MRGQRFCLGLILSLSSAACADSGGSGQVVVHPTLVVVEPRDFLGNVPCLQGEGSLETFVVTLFDVDAESLEDTDGFPLPSSPPSSCRTRVGSTFVVPGHHYTATVAAYDRSDLVAMGSRALRRETGSPIMVDEDENFVPPRWTTRCGALDPGPAEAIANRARRVRGCKPLEDHFPSDLVAVALDTGALLGELSCGLEPENIESFLVTPEGAAEPSSIECGAEGLFTELAPGAPIGFEVRGLQGGSGIAAYSAVCAATPVAGVTIAAQCSSLSFGGSIELDTSAVLELMEVSCGPDVASVRATIELGGETLVATPELGSCRGPIRFEALLPGPYELSITTEQADGEPGPSASCQAEVEAGETAAPACDPV